MSKITHLKPAVTQRYCPGCAYLVSQVEIEAMRFNLSCPRCQQHKMSEFKPAWVQPRC
jgi:uncharacterized paraquat-inducible protein A